MPGSPYGVLTVPTEPPVRDDVSPSRLAVQLTNALQSLEYVGCWATLDGAESSSLAHAIGLVRAVRNQIEALPYLTTDATEGGSHVLHPHHPRSG